MARHGGSRKQDPPYERRLYESFTHPLTILSGLPAAGLGALLTLLIFKTELNLYAFVGGRLVSQLPTLYITPVYCVYIEGLRLRLTRRRAAPVESLAHA